jgi:hypothetical protein
VQPNPKNRYANAAAALEALNPIYVIRVPEVQLSQHKVESKVSKLSERLTQTITVNNPIPDTVLEGRWEVAPHPSDPPHTPETHAWIKVAPAQFASNRAECRITVDTSQLMADKTYERQILLHTNSTRETYCLTIQVQTTAIPVATRKLPYVRLAVLLVISWAIGVVVGNGVADAAWVWAGIVVLIGAVDGIVAVAQSEARVLEVVVGIAITLLTTLLGISLGIGFNLGFLNPFAISAVFATGLPFATMILYPHWQRSRFIKNSRSWKLSLFRAERKTS